MSRNIAFARIPRTLLALMGIVLSINAEASSHREAPNITNLPKADATDFYMFNSYESGRAGYVTLIANYNPLQDAYGGPNYFSLDHRALYEIHIDNDGDAKEDITFQFRFSNQLANQEGIKIDVGDKNLSIPLKHAGIINQNSDANLGFSERYIIKKVEGHRRSRNKEDVTDAATGSRVFIKPYDYVGKKTFSDGINDGNAYSRYANQYIYDVNVPGCSHTGRVFVGQRKESFAVNLGETFDLVNYVPVEGDSAPGMGDGAGFPNGITQNKANDDLNNKNITTFALEVHRDCLAGSGNGVIGAWTSASQRQVSILNPKASFKLAKIVGGAWTQISRLSNPLVNELVIGLVDKDRFNSSHPKDDGQFADYVTNPTLPKLLDILFRDAVNTTLGLTGPDALTHLEPTNYPRNDLVTVFLTGIPNINQLAKITPSEMIRLNTRTPALAAAQQNSMGVIAGDASGFPNGRRPGDDVVDIALRVSMGLLCHNPALALCNSTDAPVGTQAFTDGAPISALDFDQAFPYLKTPVAGSPN